MSIHESGQRPYPVQEKGHLSEVDAMQYDYVLDAIKSLLEGINQITKTGGIPKKAPYDLTVLETSLEPGRDAEETIKIRHNLIMNAIADKEVSSKVKPTDTIRLEYVDEEEGLHRRADFTRLTPNIALVEQMEVGTDGKPTGYYFPSFWVSKDSLNQWLIKHVKDPEQLQKVYVI